MKLAFSKSTTLNAFHLAWRNLLQSSRSCAAQMNVFKTIPSHILQGNFRLSHSAQRYKNSIHDCFYCIYKHIKFGTEIAYRSVYTGLQGCISKVSIPDPTVTWSLLSLMQMKTQVGHFEFLERITKPRRGNDG